MRPMLDPFEQTMSKLNMLPSLTHKRENPGDPRNFAHLKHFFRVPPSNTAYPRVHPPVPHMGMNTTYNGYCCYLKNYLILLNLNYFYFLIIPRFLRPTPPS